MFKVGSIRKIEVRNFVTYNYVEMYPGPNLNMLIGPNGTGKSTMVAAIILGLGGNPKTVGRGSKVSEYVKHNCREATIHIYLQGERENDFIKISRVFTIADKSTWSINNQKTSVKEVLQCIRQFNIQVDNLCQFLPQDRVQDFAKLNQQELLKQTQLALCRDDLIEKQQSLIACRDNHKKLLAAIDKSSSKLQDTKDANVRLEGKIESFGRKKQFLSRIQDIDRKTAWIQYDNIYEKMSEIRDDLNKATEIYDKHKKAAKPVEQEIDRAKKLITELQQSSSNNTRALREKESASKNYLDKIEQSNGQIRDIENDMNVKIAEIEQRNQQVEETAAKIEEMKNAQTALVNKCGNDEEVQQKVQKITNEIKKFKRHVFDLQNKREDVMHNHQNKSAQVRVLRNDVSRLENVKQKRLEYLQKLDNDAYQAVLWLRENKRLFKGEVFEPIMLEVNVLDRKNSVYLENVIPVRDRIAFTCVLKEDMNALIRHFRSEKNLAINVVHSGTQESVASFQPSIPIEHLRKYGLYTYLHSLFTAPDPIMRYLCKTYRVHEIPIGTSQTNKCFSNIPEPIRLFFSDNQKFSVSYSSYTGARSTRQNEVNSNGGFSISLDMLHMERLQGQINELQNSMVTSDEQIKEYDNQIHLVNEKISKIGEELKYIHNVKQQAQAIETRIVAMQKKVEGLKRMAALPEEVRDQGRMKIKRVIRGMGKVYVDLKEVQQALRSLSVQNTLGLLKLEKARRNVAYIENKAAEVRELMRDSEKTLSQVKEAYANVKSQAKAALQKAKGLSNNFTPENEGFEEFREVYNSLSSDLEHLQEEKFQLNAKIECLNTANDDEMREYEERVHIIEELEGKIERAHAELENMATTMDTLQDEWLTPLRQFIVEINLNFATAFERMGCAGEVSIKPGEDEQEFDKYGLCIKVTYRNGEPLQELNNIVQSGGERAVATAIFMLSLQELTPVPFRCVDEINQGMDANNERRVFHLLLESTAQANTAQYFLITPKLVPSLTYSRTTMVHFVHNGPFIEQDRKWSMSKLCNPQRVLRH